MKTVYGGNVNQQGQDFSYLEQATGLLDDLLGASRGLVTADWDRTEDRQGRIVYTLRLSDWSGAATVEFAPWELRLRGHMAIRLNRLWGDLLQIRSHRQLDDLLEKSN